MSKRDDLIAKYAANLKDKCGIDADMDLLTKVTIGLGPSIYNADSSTVATSDPTEVARLRKNFLIGKLGLDDTPALDEGIEAMIDTYGKSTNPKHRAVACYLLVLHFSKQDVYA